MIKAFTDEIPSAELTSLKVESFDSSRVNTGDVLEVSPADPAITLSADAASASFETAVQPEGGSAEIKIGDRILQPGEKISVEELQNAEITVTTSIDGGLGNTYTFTVDVQNTVPPEDNNESDTDKTAAAQVKTELTPNRRVQIPPGIRKMYPIRETAGNSSTDLHNRTDCGSGRCLCGI